MLPVVIRSAEVILLLIPGALRESALALGAPRWKVDREGRAADSAAGDGHRRSCSPSARAAGETAPLAVHPRRRRATPTSTCRTS